VSETFYAKPGETIYPWLDNAPTGLVGTVGYRILRDSDQAEVITRTTAGIVESPVSSGRYVATLPVPVGFALDDYSIFWDIGGLGEGETATDNLIVSLEPDPSAPPPQSPGSAGPDLDGFRGASVRLRADMGRDLLYLTPTETTWPSGAVIDPQSGVPYDPTLVPLASGFSSASVNTLVVLPGATDKAAKEIEAAIGRIEEGGAALVIGREDWDENALEAATLVVIYDDEWELADARFDSVGGNDPADRVILHARQRSRTMNQGA